MTNSDKILRYEAVMDTNAPEDICRKFIIGIFPADDTVAVWESPIRNSGQVEGKWAERAAMYDKATGKRMLPYMFYVGTVVTINAVRFHLIRADEYTLKYMEHNTETY